MPRFPRSSPFVQQLSDRVFSQLAERANSQPGPVYPLHVGDTYLEPLDAAKAENQASADHPGLHKYAPVQGEPELLRAIADKVERRSGVRPKLDDLQVMPGATAGLMVVCSALLVPGDEVLLPAPFWPLIRGIIRARGALPIEVPVFDRLGAQGLEQGSDPSFDPAEALEAHITDRTVAVYVNTPNNPTGACLTSEQLESIGELARKYDLWILADEVYEDLYFGPTAPRSSFTLPAFADRTITSHSLSKAYALAGARVGYTHGPHEVMQVIRGTQTFSTYCAPRPMQFAGARALADGDAWLSRTRKLYASAAKEAADALRLPTPPAGTFLFFPSKPYRRAGESTIELLERCLEAGVMLTPGSASGSEYSDWIRLCFTCVAPADLTAALERVAGVLLES